jgi:Uma2 family endonuclease
MVIQVLSRSTRAVDLDEKWNNYLSLSSLVYYLLWEQITPQATLPRRQDPGYLREPFTGLDALIQLPEIHCHLSRG